MKTRRGLKLLLMLMICLGLISTLFIAGASLAADDVLRLKFAYYPPAKSDLGILFQGFCKDMEKATGGRIKIDFYGGGSLLHAPQVYEGIKNGITDIGYSHIEYTPGRFPVSAARQLPLGYPSGWVANQVANDFHNQFTKDAKEWNDIEVLWMHSSPPNILITTKPVRKMEDLKGMVIRAPGMVGKIVSALGATPAPTPVMEIYDAMSKGVIQGVNIPFEAEASFRFADVAKYATASWQIGNVYAFYIGMNKNSYNKIPEDLKPVFQRVCGEYREKMALVWNASDIRGKAYAEKKDVEIISLEPDQIARWQEAANTVIGEYVKEMTAKGFKEDEVKGWIKYLRDRIDYWAKAQVGLYGVYSATGPADMRK